MSEVQKAWETISKEYHTDWRNIRNLCDNVYFGRNGEFPSVSPSLTEDQQVVLEWLKVLSGTDGSLIRAVHNLYNLNFTIDDFFKGREKQAEVRSAMRRLTRQQEAEVLAAFAEWGLKEGEG